jgi:hypothetical protein
LPRISDLSKRPVETANSADAHEPGPTIERLVMLELDGERIARLHDLTAASVSLVAAVNGDETGSIVSAK